jgi:hypothetical protein
LGGRFIKKVSVSVYGFIVAVVVFGGAGDVVTVHREDGQALRVGVPRRHRVGVHTGGAATGVAIQQRVEDSGLGAWIGATVVVWLVSALATMLLLLIKKKVG